MKDTTKKKLDYSINLLRKSEALALRYNPDGGFCLAFSGGKDSQALYHVAKLAGVKFHAFFSPTSVDPPPLIRFIRRQYPDVEFMKLTTNIWEMAKKKRILPTMIRRWCCAEFKEIYGAGKVTLIGIRREESARRAKRNEVEVSSRKFSENFDQFSEHEEEMVTCVSGKDKILLSPILTWTEDDVWDLLNSEGIPHCELYDRGYKRIGCIMCPMSTTRQKLREMEEYPHVLRKWCQTIEWLEEHVWKYNEKIENITLRDRVHWWISGLSLEEFRQAYMSPTIFSKEEMGEDKIEKLIKAAFEGYETRKNNEGAE